MVFIVCILEAYTALQLEAYTSAILIQNTGQNGTRFKWR